MTHQIQLFWGRAVRLAAWPLMCGLMAAVLAPAARATEPLYEVDQSVEYGPTQVPVIDATTFFVNYATYFIVELEAEQPFETWNTLNYTNYGTIIAVSSIQLDTQITNAFGNTEHLMAGNFYNPGLIYSEGANPLLPECIVNASNVVNNNGGELEVDPNGLLQITGQNVDLSDGVLFEGASGVGSIQAIPYTTSGVYEAGSGVDTNKDWIPSTALSASSASPSKVEFGDFNPPTWQPPFGELPTTAYYEETEQATNDFIFRSVFVYNGAPNVTDAVYINGQLGGLSGSGAAAVQFTGTYTNPATGATEPEYLYVRDDYVQGSITNVPINTVDNIPNNFTFQTSLTPLITGTAETPNFTPFPGGVVTNNTYAYADAECIPTTVLTNSISQANTNYLANMVGSIQINASSNLNLSGIQVFDQNYLSVAVSNQLDGIAGANIAAPYSNYSVTATNVSLMVTNLLEPTTPAWFGDVEAWSTRWFYIYSNSIITQSTNNTFTTNTYTITNDYRVLVVGNFASPGAPSSVWNLQIRDTNSVSISDVYNILNGLSLNCTSLTLTTNAPNPGSPCGELNLSGLGYLSPVSWASATPNLRYLTNNGIILLPNQGNFGSQSAPYGALINGGEISDFGAQIWAGNFVNTGSFINEYDSFILNSQTAMMTNSLLETVADTAITTGSLITSNFEMLAERSLTLTITNLLADTGPSPTNDSIWAVGEASIGNGMKLTRLPTIANLLGTSIYDYAPTNRTTVNTWPGVDEGASNQGYTNNAAIGQLILDAEGAGPLTQLYFNGTGTSNAIYVDHLELEGYTSYLYHGSTNSIPSLGFNSNLVIYYADATDPNVGDVSFQINGFNGNHLRWVPSYTGYFSSTNVVNNGTTNVENIGLAASGYYTYFASIIPGEMNFMDYKTNNPANTMVLSWNTVPLANNFVYYSTNMVNWQLLTNAYLMTNPFVSPNLWPGVETNVMVLDPITGQGRFYQVKVSPDESNP
jgi:hypothetical protein